MADLAADLGLGLGMHKIREPLPRRLVFGRIETGAAQGNPALGAHTSHLGIDQPGAALGAFGVMHEMPIGRAAVDGLVLRHGRDDDAVLELHVAQLEGREHRRAHGAIGVGTGLFEEPFLGPLEPFRIPFAQVFMADPLAAGQHGVVQLHRVKIKVALHVLEPFDRVTRRRLQAQYLEAAGLLVFLEGRRQIGVVGDVFRERDRRFQRQFRARADREMRRGRGIAQQHDVLVAPLLAKHARELDPGRAADVAGVGHQLVPVKMVFEDLLADRDGLFLRLLAETVGVEGLLAAFDDESRRVLVELVGVNPDPALVGLLEDEGEGVVELLMRAEPNEGAAAHVDVGLESVLELHSGLGVQTVRGDNQIVVVHVFRCGLHLGLELQVHTQFAGPLLQDQQQALAPDPAEAMAGAEDRVALVVQRDVVPIGEVAADFLGRDGIIGLEIVQRLVREHDAPAEGVIGAVALKHGDIGLGLAQLERDREVQPRRTAAKTDCTHRNSPLVRFGREPRASRFFIQE